MEMDETAVREGVLGGLGLQDLTLISLAAWMATMGAVACMATETTTLVPGCTALGLLRGWFTDDNNGFEQELARLTTKVNRGDAPQPSCPSLQALETMPSQHALAAKIYTQQSKTLLNDRDLTREDQAFMQSSTQFGSGLWLNAIPSLQQFRCASEVFKMLLQIRPCLVLGFTENLSAASLACKVTPACGKADTG